MNWLRRLLGCKDPEPPQSDEEKELISAELTRRSEHRKVQRYLVEKYKVPHFEDIPWMIVEEKGARVYCTIASVGWGPPMANYIPDFQAAKWKVESQTYAPIMGHSMITSGMNQVIFSSPRKNEQLSI